MNDKKISYEEWFIKVLRDFEDRPIDRDGLAKLYNKSIDWAHASLLA